MSTTKLARQELATATGQDVLVVSIAAQLAPESFSWADVSLGSLSSEALRVSSFVPLNQVLSGDLDPIDPIDGWNIHFTYSADYCLCLGREQIFVPDIATTGFPS